MKTIEVGQPIKVDEKTAGLLALISESQWQSIDRETLRSLIPDTKLFLRFLERHNLQHTEEAKVVLSRLGIETAEPELTMVAAEMKGRAAGRAQGAAKKRRGLGVLLKHRAGHGKITARKKMRKAKRRKRAKSRKK